jgi:flagellin
MSLRIQNNIAAFNSYRNLNVTNDMQARSLEKLSSGFRINRAADDSAGLAISEGLRSQIGGLKVAVRNAQDGISVVQTAEGALTETHAILQRMRDLSVQASNDGGLNQTAKDNIQTEVTQLKAELDRIADTTSFNGKKLLDGSFTGSFQVGANAGETISVAIGTAMNASGLGVAGVDVANPVATLTGTETLAVASTAAELDIADTAGTADWTDIADAATTWEALSGTITYDGKSLDLSSIAFTDTDASGSVDIAEYTAQFDAAIDDTFGAGVLTVTHTAGGINLTSTEAPGATPTASELFALSIQFAAGSGASAAIDNLDAAIQTVSTQRANLGAVQNRLGNTINNLNVAVENLTASESRIRDTDMALEMTNFTKWQILQQAGTAMLAQANQVPQGVLQLLR